MTKSSSHKPGKELLFLALGGSGEIGMNVNLYGCDGKWLMVDLGMTFGANEYPGTELVFADLDFIEERKADLLARPATKEKDYLITLSNATTPGLPAPIDLKTETKKVVRNADDPIASPDSEGLPVIDTTLTESEHILADLIHLMSGSKQASTARP